RSHLMNPSINLDTHITDMVNVIKREELSDVALVGHSCGGVADVLPGKITSLVYLDAFVPENGQSLLSLVPPSGNPLAPPASIRWHPSQPLCSAPIRKLQRTLMHALHRTRPPASPKRSSSPAASIALAGKPIYMPTFRRRRCSRRSTRRSKNKGAG